MTGVPLLTIALALVVLGGLLVTLGLLLGVLVAGARAERRVRWTERQIRKVRQEGQHG